MGDTKEDDDNNASAPEDGSSWWGGWPVWLQAAKEKSSTALEFMKRDLSELSQVVQTDAVAAVSSTAAMLKEKLTVDNVETVAIKARDSVSSFLEVLTDVFVPMKELEGSENTEAYVIKNSEPVILGWWQAQLYNIRRDPKTYCHEPEGPPEMYENWMESFDLDDYEEEMANMMLECHEVRCLYDQLVPSSVSHSEFWHRYFYRVYLLKKAEAKRLEQMNQAAEESCTENEIEMNVGKFKQKASCGDNIAMPSEIPIGSTSVNPESRTLCQNDGLSNLCAKDSTISTCETSRENTVEYKPNLTLGAIINAQETDSKGKSLLDASDNCPEVSDACVPGEHSPIEVIGDENRSTPSDTASKAMNSLVQTKIVVFCTNVNKEYSTGDEWEKDFDLEVNIEDTKQTSEQLPEIKSKEAVKEEWEKW